ncbi:putative amidase [Protomyces lactucae-debilis]|uniref:amidase n=1 Tax=Protomyces lactucae-debilis TaxID=2754530 RepID=A0A1Y2FB63_PROLT|nr:putative amidase [Protomyces lactucae-debilis]ORY80867.1 putative amidase [Protomyces lactucae-debilis]
MVDHAAKIKETLERRDKSIPDYARLSAPPAESVQNVLDVPKGSGLLTDKELKITENYDASALLRLIARGDLTSEEVTLAFIKRASIATQLVNCCTEIMADEALLRAKKLDHEYKMTGKLSGPLHGLPVSFKEHILIKDKIVHSSYVAWLDNIEPADSLIYETLVMLGCVPFCRTTQPQAVMHLETNSNIYGHTTNPYNRNHTPGGSSGGESALLALRGSPLGVGGDIGGSIRNPASLTGLWGFKPSCNRIPGGTKGLHRGRETILATNGPLCHSLEDLILFMRVLVDAEPWRKEPSLVPIPWHMPELTKETLTVGIIWSDGVVKPLPPIQRAMDKVTDAMRGIGIKTVDFEPYNHAESWDIISQLYYTNGALDEFALFKDGGEEMLPLTKWLFTQPGVKEHSHDESNEILLRRNRYRTAYARHWLAQEEKHGTKIDVLLCPVGPGPAPKLGTSKYWTYTSVWNLVDYPGCAFPVTQVQPKDAEPSGYVPQAGVEKEVWDSYDLNESRGLPVGLQLVGRRFEEEKVLAAMGVISGALEAASAHL